MRKQLVLVARGLQLLTLRDACRKRCHFPTDIRAILSRPDDDPHILPRRGVL